MAHNKGIEFSQLPLLLLFSFQRKYQTSLPVLYLFSNPRNLNKIAFNVKINHKNTLAFIIFPFNIY